MTDFGASQDLGDFARAELADLIDLQMSPLGLAAMDALAPARGQTVLDIGCGAGQTILQLMERLGSNGQVIGVDIAPRVLAAARARAAHLPQVTLLQDDAATMNLPDQSVDCVYSRFGMMFFGEPAKAFANIRRILKPGGRIGFVCWRALAENELDYVPVNAAGLAVNVDDTPFSLENAADIENILESMGYTNISIVAHDTNVSSGDPDAMLKVVTRVGALGKILRDTPQLLPIAEPRVQAALAARERGGQVSLNTATWVVTATAG
jgi:SAM-dependent methyltransferase